MLPFDFDCALLSRTTDSFERDVAKVFNYGPLMSILKRFSSDKVLNY